MAEIKEIGHIISYFAGVAKIAGLPNVGLHEVLVDETGKEVALVIGFDQDFIEALFFEDNASLSQSVFRSHQTISLPASKQYLGRIINGLGNPLDGLGKIKGEEKPLFRSAPLIIERGPVNVPLTTGIKIIDATLPLGRGQRELIIGDRKLGKSTLAIDTVINQKNARPPVYCIYVLCGQKRRQLEKIVNLLKKNGSLRYSVIVAATAADSFAAQYLAPFVGTAIGEFFRDNGQDALIVYDDLSKHAKVYRDVSLLLERAPGREAYPGDIFSIHAQMLERAGNLSPSQGGGSLTALPIIETQEGDITSFIPTNIISITDGQIYLERGLYQRGFLPAVNIGLSVSRVGSEAQPPALRKVTSGIRLSLSQHKELQKLSQLESVISKEARKRIQKGELLLEMLKQNKHTMVSWPEQVILFYVLEHGFLDSLAQEKWHKFETLLLGIIKNHYPQLLKIILEHQLNDAAEKMIQKIIKDFQKEFAAL